VLAVSIGLENFSDSYILVISDTKTITFGMVFPHVCCCTYSLACFIHI
jgi:hypothetical protein